MAKYMVTDSSTRDRKTALLLRGVFRGTVWMNQQPPATLLAGCVQYSYPISWSPLYILLGNCTLDAFGDLVNTEGVYFVFVGDLED